MATPPCLYLHTIFTQYRKGLLNYNKTDTINLGKLVIRVENKILTNTIIKI